MTGRVIGRHIKEHKRKSPRRIESIFNIKSKVVYRFFWGRSNLYKTYIHLFIGIVSAVILISGFTVSFFSNSAKSSSLSSNQVVVGDVDLLEQGGSIQSLLVSQNTANYNVTKHKVKKGEDLEKIAKKYGVTKDTIKWANKDKIDYYEEKVKVGDTLLVPEINGVLYIVEKGDTVASVVKKIEKANKFDVIEINNLRKPDFKLTAGSRILVPGGKLAPPPKPVVYPSYDPRSPQYTNISIDSGVIVATLKGLKFQDPLSHPSCSGYGYSRGFASWHTGVDLPKSGGCPMRSVEAGTVTFAGWSSGGEGYMVTVDHGNGVKSSYYHGDGNIWVRVGQQVSKGTDLLYMGCTGYCTGTHLHLALRINGVFIDPAPYIPYRRP